MIETYTLLAIVTVQIVVVSVLQPAWFARYFRLKMEGRYDDERYARFFPDWDRVHTERFLAFFRAANLGIGVLGLGLLPWLFNLMQSPHWDVWWVRRVLSLYFMVQYLPFLVFAANRLWASRKALRRAPPEVKRTASLQRRRLFDFVSPFTVFMAILTYVLCAALSLYFWQNPVPEIEHPLRPLLVATQVYALYALVVYWMLFGKKTSPLETRAERMREALMGIKVIFYAGMILVVNIWSSLALELLHAERWMPCMQSSFFVILVLLFSKCLAVPPPAPEAAGPIRLLSPPVV